jgi:hypothetical protein
MRLPGGLARSGQERAANEGKREHRILILTMPLCEYLAESLIIGLREICGDNSFEYPRKEILRGNLPCVYGWGFTLWSNPISDVSCGPAAFEDTS